jgi:hypothetical protein
MNREDQEIVSSVSAMSAIYQSLAAVFTSDERHRHTARRLLLATGVWMPLEVYTQWPVLYPWVVRDNQLANHEKGIAHPISGLQRNDNGPIGRLKNGLPVSWATAGSAFHLKPLKRGQQQWWQSHVWEGMTTNPLTNSFVPNLVWLPEAVGRLTDPDATGAKSTLFQEEIKAIAWSLYRHAPVVEPLRETVERIWRTIPEPQATGLEPDEVDLVNWFKPTASFLAQRTKQHDQIWKAVNALQTDGNLHGIDLIPKTYRTTLPRMGPAAWESLRTHLEPFAAAADHLKIASTVMAGPEPAPKKTATAPHSKATDTALPISLDPPDKEAFKAALLATKQAEIDVVYNDGHVVTEAWDAQKFGPTSSVLGNLRSRPKFRVGAWQAAGIVELRVRVVQPV